MDVFIKRSSDEVSLEDGYRVLVCRLWPRGRTKEAVALSQWARDIAPSRVLRKWFEGAPDQWDLYKERYEAELAEPERQQQLVDLLEAAGEKSITLVYGAKSRVHNQAVILREVLLQMAESSRFS